MARIGRAVPSRAQIKKFNIPVIDAGGSISIGLTQGEIALTGLAPAMSIDSSGALSLIQGAISLTGLAPAASINNLVIGQSGAIAISGLAPALSTAIIGQVGALSVSGLAPSLSIANYFVATVISATASTTGELSVAVQFTASVAVAATVDATLDDWAPAAIPPMDRASYVLFSKEIVERQVLTKYTGGYLQILVAQTTPIASDPLTLTEISGRLYDSNGILINSGRLYIQARSFITLDNTYLFTPSLVTYDIQENTEIVIFLAPSETVLYDIQFDPTPDDTTIPKNLKRGYFKAIWQVPDTDVVDITNVDYVP